ncbi:hypothetical protein BDR26DRAFT_855033 [Obelidium mucronatum]|nr:hypothetical protein BDR26DRAFT_855033 [Obelidium mucronatum]
MWLFYWSQKFDSSDHYLFIDFEGYKFKHFRPSEYKVLNESTACQPTPPAASTLFACNASKVAVKLWDAIRRILKDVPYPTSRFIKREEMSNFMDVAQIPVDFGGLRSMVDTRSDMEEFIREEYAREGLRYEPIDIKSINWKTYKIPDIDLTVRPESAMSISSNIDFDQIDAQLEKLGLDDSEE